MWYEHHNSEHQLFSFGYNNNGQLCLSDNRNRNKPEQIQFSKEIQSFLSGKYHTLILDTSNRVWVFGMKYLEGDRIDGYYDGIMLNEPSDVCLMSSGGDHVLLKCASNEIWAFGRNDYHQIPLPIPEEDENGDQIIRKPEKIRSEYFHFIGKSARNLTE